MRNKIIAAGVGLFGYGLLVGWAVTADRYDRKMKSNQKVLGDIIARQDQKITQTQALLIKDSRTPEKDEIEDEIEEKFGPEMDVLGIGMETVQVSEDDEPPEDENDVIPEGETEEETRSNLQGLIDRYTSDEDDVHQFNTIANREIKQNYPPFVIPQIKYAWDEEEGDQYDKITLTYYPRERILLDEDDEMVEDVNAMVGWKSLARFGDESGDPDTVFVRNRALLTDFEVIRDTESQPPLHIRYGMGRDEFETNKAAGLIRFRTGDV